MTFSIKAFLAACTVLFASSTQAAISLTLAEVGPNVILTGSGSANLADLSDLGESETYALFAPSVPVALVGSSSDTYAYYEITGPLSIGSEVSTDADLTSGDAFGIVNLTILDPDFLTLVVPNGYVSGTPLSGTATFLNHSFDSLGFTPGSYTWNWGSGGNADSLTLSVAVPEPSTWAALAGAGVMALAIWRKRR